MIRRYAIVIIGFILCGSVFSGCATKYATKSNLEGLEVKVAQLKGDLEETSAQIRNETKTLHARVEGSYQGSIEALAEMKRVAEVNSVKASEAQQKAEAVDLLVRRVDVDTRQCLANLREKVLGTSLGRQEIKQLRRDFEVMKSEYDRDTDELSRSVLFLRGLMNDMVALYRGESASKGGRLLEVLLNSPATFQTPPSHNPSERYLAYSVGEREKLTLSWLASHSNFPLWRLRVLNNYAHDIILAEGDIVLFGKRESHERPISFNPDQLLGQFGYLTFNFYRVRPGDCLSKIGSKFGVSLMSLVRWNRIERMDVIESGSFLMIPRITDIQ